MNFGDDRWADCAVSLACNKRDSQLLLQGKFQNGLLLSNSHFLSHMNISLTKLKSKNLMVDLWIPYRNFYSRQSGSIWDMTNKYSTSDSSYTLLPTRESHRTSCTLKPQEPALISSSVWVGEIIYWRAIRCHFRSVSWIRLALNFFN